MYKLSLSEKQFSVLREALNFTCVFTNHNMLCIHYAFKNACHNTPDIHSVDNLLGELFCKARKLFPSSISEACAISAKLSFTASAEDKTLCLSENECNICCNALDQYSRCLMGQFSIFLPLFSDNREEAIPTLLALRNLYFPELNIGINGSYGICSPDIPEESKLAYEMYKVIKHKMWLDGGKTPKYCVDSDGPLKLTEEPLIIIEKV